MTSVCAYCQKEDRLLTILDGTSVEQALLDLEAGDLSHGACQPHFEREMDKVWSMQHGDRYEDL
mgnify:CR=1 FL=1